MLDRKSKMENGKSRSGPERRVPAPVLLLVMFGAVALAILASLMAGPASASQPFGTAASVYVNAGVPVNGTSGTLAKIAKPGSLLSDSTNGGVYQNQGTKASPTWVNTVGAIGAGAVGTTELASAGVTKAKLAFPRLARISETFLKSAFTDGGSTVGTKTMATQIPVGAVFVYSEVVVNVAFSGDTTAVLTIGDGSDVDRYNTGTPSIFTTGAKEFGPPSGNRYHPAAATVTLTVTSTADFTNVNVLGSITVNLYYIETA